MIFTRFGSQVEIVGYCGKHKVRVGTVPMTMMLVKVRYVGESGHDRFQFAHTLKADGGYPEIDAAVDAAPTIALPAKELNAAMREAE